MNKFEFIMGKARFARYPVLIALLLTQFVCIVGGAATYFELSWLLAVPAGLAYFFVVRSLRINCLMAVAGAHFGLGMEWPLVVATVFGLYALLHIVSSVASSLQEFAV